MKNQSIFLLILLMVRSFDAGAQIVDIPDPNFKSALVHAAWIDIDGDYVVDDGAKVDTNNDGEIQVTEAEAVFGLEIKHWEIYSVAGIEAFSNLKWLDISFNHISSLPLENMPELTRLDCSVNELTTLDVPLLVHLRHLSCWSNSLTSLDLHNCTQLEFLDCSFNELPVLDVQGLSRLKSLACAWNSMNSLNVQGLDSLTELNCRSNQLTTLDLQGISSLQRLKCWENQLTTLDLQSAPDLVELNCQSNQLATLYLKNGNPEPMGVFYFGGNPLVYICCEESLIWYVEQKAIQYELMDCSINSFCKYTPGSTANHTLQGTVRTDFNGNGCDIADPVLPGTLFQISDGIGSGMFIANSSGHYNISLNAGDYTVVPVVGNAGYFTTTPDTLEVNFPVDPTSISQNFCISPNGIHHDVEVNLFPISPARPGFEASYRILYENKGTQLESGSVFFLFDQSRMTLIDASVAPDALLPDTLRWDFVDLLPLESAAIYFRFTINTPSQTPPVNVGDILSLTAESSIPSVEATPEDNISQLRQIVVGSYDPNDKTCLEGTLVTPGLVSDYLHYLIRFENTGTFAAENVVVRDFIDVSKFDIASLRVVETSHDCVARINGNQVEFIFENIHLPFTEPDKHGFVVFKIKTKPALAFGTVITNKAAIYFDYNLPVITNVATSIVSEASVTYSPGEKRMNLRLQPNPAQDILFLQTDQPIERVEIYDALGRVVLSTGVQNRQIDIVRLPQGVYQVKVFGRGAVAVKQMVKQ